MTRTTTVGLLPLYLKLYDDTKPETRAEFDPFIGRVAGALAQRGLQVVRGEVCRVQPEFDAAVERFEQAGADAIITLHLAYSPSLESLKALTKTDLPIVMLDVTMDAAFGPDVAPERIMYNHGIHGVMDLASMLRREGKSYEVVAGHVDDQTAMDRAAELARAARAARALRTTRALRIGPAFEGMGDFAVGEDVLAAALGIEATEATLDELAPHVEKVSAEDIAAEVAADRDRYDCQAPAEAHERSVRVGLGLRRMLDEGGHNAFSMNFLAFDRGDGPVNVVPFLAASKAMARGVGYAGEGDVLTAALVRALASGVGQTTFTEIFCPDWRGGTLFLSHMGEINPDVAAEKPRLVSKPFPYTPAADPAVVVCACRPGPALFVNLAPGPDDSFGLVAAPVEVLEDTSGEPMQDVVRTWIRPRLPVQAFLEEYSRHGGTHHSALLPGEKTRAVEAFARYAGLTCHVIE